MGVQTVTDAPAPELSTRRERVGWYFYDWANSAFATTVVSVFLGPYLTHIAEHAAHGASRLHPLGIPVAPGSVFPYTVSLSVLCQVLVLPVVGAIADRSSHKKQLLALFAYVGAAATVAFAFVNGGRYLLGVGLFIVANVALGGSSVIYNSFLPQLAGPEDRDKVSAVGWAIGYIGGGVLLALNLAVFTYVSGLDVSDSTADHYGWLVARWSIVSAGVWWAAFTVLPLIRLRNRPAVAGEATGSVLTDGFRQLRRTLREMRGYPLTLAFLGAYIVYNEGIQTVITMASVFADKQLGLSKNVQIETILLVQFVAFGGALWLGRLARRYGSRNTVAASLLVWMVTLVIAYFLPHGSAVPFMLLGALIAIVLGGSQALSRSIFSQLIPHGREAEYFGVYEISSDGTTWLGPLAFGLAYQITGNYRIAIVSMLVFFVVGFAALLAVPLRRAIEAAGNTPPHRV